MDIERKIFKLSEWEPGWEKRMVQPSAQNWWSLILPWLVSTWRLGIVSPMVRPGILDAEKLLVSLIRTCASEIIKRGELLAWRERGMFVATDVIVLLLTCHSTLTLFSTYTLLLFTFCMFSPFCFLNKFLNFLLSSKFSDPVIIFMKITLLKKIKFTNDFYIKILYI